MLKIIFILITSTTYICHSEAFFINSKDIRKFFGFSPSRIYRIFKKDDDDDIRESYQQDDYYKENYKDNPHNVNEKLNRYAKERPTDLLDIEDSNQHENVEEFSKNKQKAKPRKESRGGAKVLKIKIVKEDETLSRNGEADFSRLLLLVPDGGSKYTRDEDDEFHQDFLKYFTDSSVDSSYF